MKKSTMPGLVFLVVSTFFLANIAWSATQTFEGVVSDSMCGKSHMMPGKSDAQCVQECINAGSNYVLVSGTKVFTLNAKPQVVAPFGGKRVQVHGELTNMTVNVESIHQSSTR